MNQHRTELLLRFKGPTHHVKATITGLIERNQTLDVWSLRFVGQGLVAVELDTKGSKSQKSSSHTLQLTGVEVDQRSHALVLIVSPHQRYNIVIEKSEGELEQLYKDCTVIAAGGWLLSSNDR